MIVNVTLLMNSKLPRYIVYRYTVLFTFFAPGRLYQTGTLFMVQIKIDNFLLKGFQIALLCLAWEFDTVYRELGPIILGLHFNTFTVGRNN